VRPWIAGEIVRGIGGIALAYAILLLARLLQRRVVATQDRALDLPPRHQR
jgi:hypothetical protein